MAIMVTLPWSHEVPNMTKKIEAKEFQAKCMKILDDVVREQETVYITKQGKVVAELSLPQEQESDIRKSLQGSIVFEDDLVSPLDEAWQADK
jgi:antitoxin (DNA-binding transcriptional repressor) of toxin-antitoxin stability system